MYQSKNEIIARGKHQLWNVCSGLYFIAFIIGTIQLFIAPLMYQPAISAPILIAILCLYLIIRTLYVFHQREHYIPKHAILGVDIAVCIILLSTTGGLHSPFLLFTFVPVVTVGLLFEERVTAGIVFLTVVYVTLIQIWNPFLPTQLTIMELERLLFYLVIIFLIATLPYMMNIGLRQRIESQGILSERLRLSHEIHDGVAQLVSTLCWQVQFVQSRLANMNIYLDEVKQLLSITEKVQQDVRECLSFLRNDEKCKPLVELEVYKKTQSHQVEIESLLRNEISEVYPQAMIEAQLLYIFREALINIRKHSKAHEIRINIQTVDGQLQANIIDDGCGFDILAVDKDGTCTVNHGLAVMRERAESIGGTVEVISSPLKGTEIKIEIPITNGVHSSTL